MDRGKKNNLLHKKIISLCQKQLYNLTKTKILLRSILRFQKPKGKLVRGIYLVLHLAKEKEQVDIIGNFQTKNSKGIFAGYGGVNMLIENAELKITPYDTPWEVACLLINAEYERKNILEQMVTERFFEIDDLRRIGEHIVNYCNAEQKEIEGE